MKLLFLLSVLTCINCMSCDENVLDLGYDHHTNCKLSIEREYRNSCTIKMRPSYMGRAVMQLQKGNDSTAIEFCRLVPEGANCVLDNLPTLVTNDCKLFEEYQSKIITALYSKIYSEHFCANDMQFLRDRSELDGSDCLYVSEFYHCKHYTHKTTRIRTTKKEEYCRDNSLDMKCKEHWGTCENQKVRNNQIALFDALHLGLGCPEVN